MRLRRGMFPLVAMILFASAMGYAQDRKMTDQQKKEIQNVVKIVDDLASGQTAPNDLSASWLREDFLKAQGNKEYVPFAVALDPSKLAGGNIAFYWRVVAKGGDTAGTAAAGAATAGQKKDDKKDKKKA